MKKFLVAGVAGLMLMAVAGTTTTAMAAGPWRGGYRGHVAARPAYRTVYAPGYRHFGPVYHGPIFRDYRYCY